MNTTNNIQESKQTNNCKCLHSSEQYRELVCENYINHFECKLSCIHSWDDNMIYFHNSDNKILESEFKRLSEEEKESLHVKGKFAVCSVCQEPFHMLQIKNLYQLN